MTTGNEYLESLRKGKKLNGKEKPLGDEFNELLDDDEAPETYTSPSEITNPTEREAARVRLRERARSLKSVDALTPQEELFVKNYCLTFDGKDAALKAGYTKAPTTIAHRLLAKDNVRLHIQFATEDCQVLFMRSCVEAIDTLREVMLDESAKDSSRVMAANSILEKAGYKAVERVRIEQDEPMDRERITAQLVGMMASALGGERGRRILESASAGETIDITGDVVRSEEKPEPGEEKS